MKNWDDLIITLLVLLFTFGGGIKELLRRKKSADRSRPYLPRRDRGSEEVEDLEELEEQDRQPHPVRPSPVSTTPIGEPQSWQEILEMLRPKEAAPREIFEPESAKNKVGESNDRAPKMLGAEDDEFREVGQSLKIKDPILTLPLAEVSGPVHLQFKPKSSFQFKTLKRNWGHAMVLTEILGPPKGLR
jgi:hypothetical protein